MGVFSSFPPKLFQPTSNSILTKDAVQIVQKIHCNIVTVHIFNTYLLNNAAKRCGTTIHRNLATPSIPENTL